MKRIPILVGGLLLLIALLICGCGELEIGVETRLSSGRPDPVTVVVTATGQPTETVAVADNIIVVTVTPTGAGVNSTPTQIAGTETATVTPTETATPTATPTPRATTRPVVPTATPALPRIVSFTAVPDSVRPGGTISANWTAEGQSALLCLRFASGYTDNCYEVPVSGSKILAVEADFRENVLLDLFVYNSAGQEALASIFVAVTCPASFWFFDNPPENCPGSGPVESFAAVQYFENGWMLWLEETDTIYVFSELQRTFGVFYSGFGDPDDPAAENDDYDPPEGLFVPKRGFGLVWRNYSYWRGLLGWALAPEFGFDTTYQTGANPYEGQMFVLDPDGRLVVMNTTYLTWSVR